MLNEVSRRITSPILETTVGRRSSRVSLHCWDHFCCVADLISKSVFFFFLLLLCRGGLDVSRSVLRGFWVLQKGPENGDAKLFQTIWDSGYTGWLESTCTHAGKLAPWKDEFSTDKICTSSLWLDTFNKNQHLTSVQLMIRSKCLKWINQHPRKTAKFNLTVSQIKLNRLTLKKILRTPLVEYLKIYFSIAHNLII